MSQHFLTQEQITYFENRLLEMKNELQEDLSSTSKDNAQESVQELADFQNHPADQGTAQYEQELDKGLTMMNEDKLKEVKDALSKIKNGTYGVSEKSGEPIPIERLEAQPTARNRIEEEIKTTSVNWWFALRLKASFTGLGLKGPPNGPPSCTTLTR